VAWISSAEAQRFSEIASEVIDSIKNQGPLDPSAFTLELEAAERTVTGEIVRWLMGKEVKITSQADVYGRPWEPDRFESILDGVVEREYQKNLMHLALQQGCTTVRQISERTGLELGRVSYLLADLEQTNRVEFRGMKDKKPVFAAL